jgi:hypothetical protein
MLIDEADSFLAKHDEMRGVLDSGHKRSGAYVLRCVGDDAVPTRFSTWAPKVIAGLRRLHPTLESRAIFITLQRKLPNETVQDLPNDENAYLDLQRKCARWANDNLEKLRSADPSMPSEFINRLRDNWRPLFAIAELAGGEWPRLALKAARLLSREEGEQEHSVLLLQDLRDLFEVEEAQELSSFFIVAALVKMEDRPWPEYKQDKPITQSQLAQLLKRYKVKPGPIRWKGAQARGYRRTQLEPLFERYLSEKKDE